MSTDEINDLAIQEVQPQSRDSERLAPHRMTWDDFSMLYQTTNEWDYPGIHHYKSQNPSPKHECFSEHHRDISPLSGFHHDSETEDMDTSSASSVSPTPPQYRDAPTPRTPDPTIVAHSSKNSMEDMMDTSDDYADPQNTFRSSDEATSIEDRKVSVSVSMDDKQALSIGSFLESKQGSITQNDTDIRIIVMEMQLSDMNDKILKLMKNIRELKDKNSDLERSKLDLITNTAHAMNQYRDTIRKLNQQNNRLLEKITKT
eukprot:580158_1